MAREERNKLLKPIKVSVQEIYNQDKNSYEQFLHSIDKSLNPRSPEILFEKFGSFCPNKKISVLDIGCRDAYHACIISERFGCHVEGIDIVDENIKSAKINISNKDLENKIHVIQGDIQELPYDNDSFDIIWCRDVLTHIKDLQRTFNSCARVLKSNGKMLIFHVTATNLLTSEEADNLVQPLATIKQNLSQSFFETAFESAGFSCLEKDVIGTEWRESYEETESKLTSKQLLRIARLKRNKDQFITQFGEKRYASELANCHWGVYQMLGKLCPIIYTLKKVNNL